MARIFTNGWLSVNGALDKYTVASGTSVPDKVGGSDFFVPVGYNENGTPFTGQPITVTPTTTPYSSEVFLFVPSGEPVALKMQINQNATLTFAEPSKNEKPSTDFLYEELKDAIDFGSAFLAGGLMTRLTGASGGNLAVSVASRVASRFPAVVAVGAAAFALKTAVNIAKNFLQTTPKDVQVSVDSSHILVYADSSDGDKSSTITQSNPSSQTLSDKNECQDFYNNNPAAKQMIKDVVSDYLEKTLRDIVREELQDSDFNFPSSGGSGSPSDIAQATKDSISSDVDNNIDQKVNQQRKNFEDGLLNVLNKINDNFTALNKKSFLGDNCIPIKLCDSMDSGGFKTLLDRYLWQDNRKAIATFSDFNFYFEKFFSTSGAGEDIPNTPASINELITPAWRTIISSLLPVLAGLYTNSKNIDKDNIKEILAEFFQANADKTKKVANKENFAETMQNLKINVFAETQKEGEEL